VQTDVSSSSNYEILKPIQSKQTSCPCCASIEQHLDFETKLYNGFGGWMITKNGECYYQAENGDWENSKTLREIELEAKLNPNNNWMAILFTPLRGAEYQRQNDKWVLVEQNEGFA
jgi:hypothetical protein